MLQGVSVVEQEKLDNMMIEMDGTENKCESRSPNTSHTVHYKAMQCLGNPSRPVIDIQLSCPIWNQCSKSETFPVNYRWQFSSEITPNCLTIIRGRLMHPSLITPNELNQ